MPKNDNQRLFSYSTNDDSNSHSEKQKNLFTKQTTNPHHHHQEQASSEPRPRQSLTPSIKGVSSSSSALTITATETSRTPEESHCSVGVDFAFSSLLPTSLARVARSAGTDESSKTTSTSELLASPFLVTAAFLTWQGQSTRNQHSKVSFSTPLVSTWIQASKRVANTNRTKEFKEFFSRMLLRSVFRTSQRQFPSSIMTGPLLFALTAFLIAQQQQGMAHAYSTTSSTVAAEQRRYASEQQQVQHQKQQVQQQQQDVLVPPQRPGYPSTFGMNSPDQDVATSETPSPPLSHHRRFSMRARVSAARNVVHSSAVSPLVPHCPFYGCPLFATDVHYGDAATKDTLQRMRSLTFSQVQHQAAQLLTGPTRAWNRRDAAALTLIGYKGGPLQQQINQDRAVVISPFVVHEPVRNQPKPLGISSHRILLGVFDGHATRGELVSEHTVVYLPPLLARKLEHLPPTSDPVNRQAATVRALEEAFVEMDQEVPADPSGGSTATLILRQDEQIYIANAGDSQAFVVVYRPPQQTSKKGRATVLSQQMHSRWNQIDSDPPSPSSPSSSTGTTEVVFTSEDDTPDRWDEKARVEAMGGQVYVPIKGTSRVVYQDPHTGAPAGLAISRSIGDWAAGKLGVIPNPTVTVLEIDDLVEAALYKEPHHQRPQYPSGYTMDDSGDLVDMDPWTRQPLDLNALAEEEEEEEIEDDVYIFGVTASDGMMDYLTPDDVARIVGPSLFGPPDESQHIVSACEILVFSAANEWQDEKQGRYRDDISLAVSVLRRPPNARRPTTYEAYQQQQKDRQKQKDEQSREQS